MTDVLVVGGGPAGLGAAEWLARQGLRVALVERQGETGGIPRHCGHSPFGLREFRRVLSGRGYARRLTDAAVAAGAEMLCSAHVTAIGAGLACDITTPEGPRRLTPRRILLATGAREASRAERLLPGERAQGVITTGALQDLWFARGLLPFRRPVILGTELVAMSAVLTCHQAGATPVAVVEPGPQAVARAPFRWLPRMLGIPFHPNTAVADLVARDGRLAEVVLQEPGGTLSLQADGLVLTGGFRPESGLARMAGLAIDPATGGPLVDARGQTSRPGIFAAGNLLRGVETAGWCWAEARRIAAAIARDLAAPMGQAALVVLPGAGIRQVMPQRLGDAPHALGALQVRLEERLRGRLEVVATGGRVVWSRRLDSGPERRILIPLDGLARVADGPLTVQARRG